LPKVPESGFLDDVSGMALTARRPPPRAALSDSNSLLLDLAHWSQSQKNDATKTRNEKRDKRIDHVTCVSGAAVPVGILLDAELFLGQAMWRHEAAQANRETKSYYRHRNQPNSERMSHCRRRRDSDDQREDDDQDSEQGVPPNGYYVTVRRWFGAATGFARVGQTGCSPPQRVPSCSCSA
jgi:hypothetical protein